jgi:hypothetical protein
MNLVLLFIAIAIMLAVIGFLVRPRPAPTYRIEVDDIPKVLAALSAVPKGPASAVFVFAPADGSVDPDDPDDRVNLQFSLEDGRPGFDWVLQSHPNIRDEARFANFARDAGYSPEMEYTNGVRYLRVEEGDLVRLCQDVMTKMYRQAGPVELIVEGFAWKR